MFDIICARCDAFLFDETEEYLLNGDLAHFKRCSQCDYQIISGLSAICGNWKTEQFNIDIYSIIIHHHYGSTWFHNNFTGKDLIIQYIVNSKYLTLDKIKTILLFS